jgi:hypothetical protein
MHRAHLILPTSTLAQRPQALRAPSTASSTAGCGAGPPAETELKSIKETETFDYWGLPSPSAPSLRLIHPAPNAGPCPMQTSRALMVYSSLDQHTTEYTPMRRRTRLTQ